MQLPNKDTLLAAHHHRHVRFDGACNVRDLGGLPTADGGVTRHGVLYRADSLARLSAQDLERLVALGISTIVDLRTADECARAPDRLPPGRAFDVYNPGFLPRGNLEMLEFINTGTCDPDTATATMIHQYRLLAREHLAEFRVVLDLLRAPGRHPLLFHCASGKDRTGLAAALVLLAVDVPVDWVVQDYTISNFQRREVDLFRQAAPNAAMERAMAADPRYLLAAIDTMRDEFGSIDRYLAEGLGLDAAARRALRQVLVV